MKKLILTIFASSFLLSCSTNSSNEESNSSSGSGMLPKTSTSGSKTTTYNYNGNKIVNILSSDGGSATFTYNGEFIIAENSVINNGVSGLYNSTSTMNYSNNLLSSYAQNGGFTNYSDSDTINKTYTYNQDGSITENVNIIHTNSLGNTTITVNKYIRFYSQGNCIKAEAYGPVNGIMTLTDTRTYTYDTNNNSCKNITGLYAYYHPIGVANNNNIISETNKNANGVITKTIQRVYQYNSQNYPISMAETITNYSPNPQTGTSTPGTPTVSNTTLTYY